MLFSSSMRLMCRNLLIAFMFSIAVSITAQTKLRADEAGVGFWLPGSFGSLAAVPGTPGWSLGIVYLHSDAKAGGNLALNQGGNLHLGLGAKVDSFFFFPTYTFETPVLGGRLSMGLGLGTGRPDVSVDATLAGPGGAVVSGARSDRRWAFSDLYPQVQLKWNEGVHNYMVYTQWGIPIGTYDTGRLANLGTNHWSADFGLGYTYFNPHSGWEFSVVGGMTYNFENPATNYKNGVDGHIDWAASKFLTKQLHVGAVGYIYQQLSGDSGIGATLGDFKSSVVAAGPQIGYMFPLGDKQGYLNLKAYYEFDAHHRPEGWNVWLTFAISPSPHHAKSPRAASR